MPDGSTVFLERKRHFRKGQRREGKIMLDMPRFGFFGAQKFSARGQIEKQLPHFDGSAGRTTRGFHFDDLSAIYDDLSSLRCVGVPFTRGESESAHTRDAWQCFASKTHRRDYRQIFCSADFAGCMAFQAEQ